MKTPVQKYLEQKYKIQSKEELTEALITRNQESPLTPEDWTEESSDIWNVYTSSTVVTRHLRALLLR